MVLKKLEAEKNKSSCSVRLNDMKRENMHCMLYINLRTYTSNDAWSVITQYLLHRSNLANQWLVFHKFAGHLEILKRQLPRLKVIKLKCFKKLVKTYRYTINLKSLVWILEPNFMHLLTKRYFILLKNSHYI